MGSVKGEKAQFGTKIFGLILREDSKNGGVAISNERLGAIVRGEYDKSSGNIEKIKGFRPNYTTDEPNNDDGANDGTESSTEDEEKKPDN